MFKACKVSDNKKHVKKQIIEVFSWIFATIFSIIIGYIIIKYIAINSVVPSRSMQNTIMAGDRIFVYKLAYIFEKPKRFDVIVFDFPDNTEEKLNLYIKRVIGLPGETLLIKGNDLYINDEKIDAPDYTKSGTFGTFGPYTIPKDSYFVMGDNRSSSQDSREWATKYVPKDKIQGKAIFRYYPKFKLIN